MHTMIVPSLMTVYLLATNLVPGVDAHGYLQTPRSRNYRAHIDGKWYGGTAVTPSVETEPQSLNIGGTEARCGKVADRDYDYPRNALNGNLVEVAQECYEEGAIINIKLSSRRIIWVISSIKRVPLLLVKWQHRNVLMQIR